MRTLRGTVTYRQRSALPPGSVIMVQLADVSRADAPATLLASQEIRTSGEQVPIPFSLAPIPADLPPSGRYAVQARIMVEDELRFITTTAHLVDPAATPESFEVVVEPASAGVARAQVTGVEWSLVELNGAPAPRGAGDRPATLLLDDSARASGFGGCNRIAGSYELAADSLRFGPLIGTEMACDQGMELERAYGAALEATRGFRVTGSGLELFGADGVIARFQANP